VVGLSRKKIILTFQVTVEVSEREPFFQHPVRNRGGDCEGLLMNISQSICFKNVIDRMQCGY
jgi:hypothetical protein